MENKREKDFRSRNSRSNLIACIARKDLVSFPPWIRIKIFSLLYTTFLLRMHKHKYVSTYVSYVCTTKLVKTISKVA